MRIVGIQSSPKRKNSNTLKLLDAALDGARSAGAEVELIDVTRLKIKYCTGCVACYRDGFCHQKDDYAALKEKILAADGIILTSPNYIDNITGQLKTVLDRSANFIHEQLLDGKYGLTITTSGSGNDRPVLDVLNHFVNITGGLLVGEVCCGMGYSDEAFEEAVEKSRAMGKDLVAAISEKRAYPEQAAAHQYWKDRFARTVTKNKDKWKHNYECWVARGWVEV